MEMRHTYEASGLYNIRQALALNSTPIHQTSSLYSIQSISDISCEEYPESLFMIGDEIVPGYSKKFLQTTNSDLSNLDFKKAFYKTEEDFNLAFLSNYNQLFDVEDVYLGESIKHIPDNFFKECNSLTALQLPPSLESIGKDAFKNVYSLKVLVVPTTLSSFPAKVFNNIPADCSVYFIQNEPLYEPNTSIYTSQLSTRLDNVKRIIAEIGSGYEVNDGLALQTKNMLFGGSGHGGNDHVEEHEHTYSAYIHHYLAASSSKLSGPEYSGRVTMSFDVNVDINEFGNAIEEAFKKMKDFHDEYSKKHSPSSPHGITDRFNEMLDDIDIDDDKLDDLILSLHSKFNKKRFYVSYTYDSTLGGFKQDDPENGQSKQMTDFCNMLQQCIASNYTMFKNLTTGIITNNDLRRAAEKTAQDEIDDFKKMFGRKSKDNFGIVPDNFMRSLASMAREYESCLANAMASAINLDIAKAVSAEIYDCACQFSGNSTYQFSTIVCAHEQCTYPDCGQTQHVQEVGTIKNRTFAHGIYKYFTKDDMGENGVDVVYDESTKKCTIIFQVGKNKAAEFVRQRATWLPEVSTNIELQARTELQHLLERCRTCDEVENDYNKRQEEIHKNDVKILQLTI